MKKRWLLIGVFVVIGSMQAQPRSRTTVPLLTLEYLHYRPATWDSVNIKEEPYEINNKGGYVFAYFRNTSEQRQRIREWNWNRNSGAKFRLAGRIAWDRNHHSTLEPGQLGVLEICGLSEDFSSGKLMELGFIGGNWRSIGRFTDTLAVDPVRISFIKISKDLASLDIHICNGGPTTLLLQSVAIEGHALNKVAWTTQDLQPQGLAIVRLKLDEPLKSGALVVVKVEINAGGKTRLVYGHRRAHADRFPIGTWGAEPEHFELVRQHHIDTIVKGGTAEDEFYSFSARKYGFATMVHTGVYPNAKTLFDLGQHPVVHCWMVHDEPDWSMTPQMIFTSVEATHQINSQKPTMITLCRNGKFFEYAFLPDIAAQDHYSVSAPSSSIWKHRYGTRLEETAIYTADLKRAAEPKPIWVWSQGIHDWDERPKRPLPTVDELGAQFLFNLGRGAKGILWFTFHIAAGETYPDLRQAIQKWNRVLLMTRDDLLSAESINASVRADGKLDVAVLASWDKLFVFIVNTDYDVDDEAYQWRSIENAKITLTVPSWIDPKSAIQMDGEEPKKITFIKQGREITLQMGNLDMGKFLVIDGIHDSLDRYNSELKQIKLLEK